MRMFVALPLPEPAAEHLEEFLAPRQEAEPTLRWTAPEQWHVTLAFLPDVADRVLDDLEERLARAARRRSPVELALAGGGAFPDPAHAKVLYAGIDGSAATPAASTRPDPDGGGGDGSGQPGPGHPGHPGGPDRPGHDATEELRRLATGARAAATKAGAEVRGGRFHPHVTLARTGRPREVTRLLRVLEGYRGPSWRTDEVALVESHLGEGPRRRPRYEVRATFGIGRQPGAGAETRP